MSSPRPKTSRLSARRVLRAVLAVLLFVAPPAFARQDQPLSVTAELSAARVYVGEAFILQVRVAGSSSAEIPTLPTVPGLESRYKGGQDISSHSTVIINGRRRDVSQTAYIMQFELVLSNPGSITIPSFEVRAAGNVLRTNELRVAAVPPQEDPDVRLRIEIDNPSPYIGEPIRLKLTLGLSRTAATADFTIPGVEAKFEPVSEPDILQQFRDQTTFEILGQPVPATQGSSTFDGVQMTSYSAERVIIPREAGQFTIGPATAGVEVITRKAMSIFDRDQTRRAVVPSNPLTIAVRPLPTEGRPSNFNGLIGRYRIAAAASPVEVNVGDPITLTIRVEGPLADSVDAPALERQANLVEGFKVAAENPPGTTTGRGKTFTRVLRALSPEVKEIPPIELPYFDTQTGRYDAARSDPIPIIVRETRVVTAADAEGRVGEGPAPVGLAVEERAGGIRFNYEGEGLLVDQSFDLALAFRTPVAFAAAAAPPAAYAAVVGIAIARRRASANAPANRRRRALAEARAALAAASEPAAVAAAMRRYIAAKFDQQSEALTTRECADLAARRAPADADALFQLLSRCDAALFGNTPLAESAQLRADADALLTKLNQSLEGKS